MKFEQQNSEPVSLFKSGRVEIINVEFVIFISFVSVQTCKKMFYLSDLTKDIKFLNWLFIPSTTLNIRLCRPSLCILVQVVNKNARKIGILKSGSKVPVDMDQFCFYVSSSSPVAFSLESKTQLHRYLAVYIGGLLAFSEDRGLSFLTYEDWGYQTLKYEGVKTPRISKK